MNGSKKEQELGMRLRRKDGGAQEELAGAGVGPAGTPRVLHSPPEVGTIRHYLPI